MAERRGHPVAAGAIVLLTAMGAFMGWVAASWMVDLSYFPEPDYDWGDAPVVLALAATGMVVVAGLWLAWRLGTGGWGLRVSATTRAAEAISPAPRFGRCLSR